MVNRHLAAVARPRRFGARLTAAPAHAYPATVQRCSLKAEADRQKMSRLIEAAQRLKAATDVLERAAAKSPVVAARAEDRELRAALDAARRENQTLSEAAEDVSGRLDKAIRRIQSMLES